MIFKNSGETSSFGIALRSNSKAVMYLCKRGYCIKKDSISLEELSKLKSELRAVPRVDEKYDFGEKKSFPVYTESKEVLCIPKMFGIMHYGIPASLSNYSGKEWNISIPFVGELYDNQKEPVQKLLKSLNNIGGGLLSCGVGCGKSILALYTISQLKGKTIIIVNSISLLNQWKEEIKTFLPNARVGIIQGKYLHNSDDYDITIAMIQTLSKDKLTSEAFNSYRIAIYDEIHLVGSEIFSKVLFKVCCKYSIGLTATPIRSDGCENVFKWHIGEVVYASTAVRDGMPPIIIRKCLSSEYYQDCVDKNDKINYTGMISKLLEMKSRNKFIINTIKEVCKDPNRKILVLSERRRHLEVLFKLLSEANVSFTFGLHLGAMKDEVLAKARSCQVILATFASFSVGVSEKMLNTLLLCSPKKYNPNEKETGKKENMILNQIIGRIFRINHTERNPIIIDIQDDFSVYRNQSRGRNIFYKTFFKKAINKYDRINLDNGEISESTCLIGSNSQEIGIDFGEKCMIE